MKIRLKKNRWVTLVYVGILTVCKPSCMGRQVGLSNAKFHAIILLMT